MTTPSQPPLLTLDEALQRVLDASKPVGATETVATAAARGRVLATDIRSELDVPAADNSAMDGYALRAADLPKPGMTLAVSQRIAAGVVGAPLQTGTAARIFTGAHLPAGADAVVMQEQCEALDAGVRIKVTPTPGDWVRQRGEDVRKGAVVLPRGTRLTPQALGLAAAVGCAEVSVAQRPRVALLSSGDELTMPGEALKPGAIYNANRFSLRGLLESLGCECTDLGTVADQREATRAALRQAAADHDVIVSSGGMSVGEEDHLKPAVEAEGRLDLWSVAIKPGKPLAFGEVRRGDGSAAWFIGLPGNPVSSFVTFLLVVRPFLLHLQGATALTLPAIPLRADFDWPRPDPRRREFLRVCRNASGGLDLFANQGSGVLTSVVWSDGLVDNPPGQVIGRGDRVAYLPLAELLS